MSRVLLVNMPFANLRWPNIALGLLKAGLRRRGIGCDVAYFNFDFAEQVGRDRYDWIADHFAFVLGGERLFATHCFPGELPDEAAYYRDVLLAADPAMTEADRRDYQRTARYVEPFLEKCEAALDWPVYDVVGFTTSFQQIMPSVCLARRIKRRRPQMRIVFGGAACEAEMGIELLRQFPVIDHVFLGEADRTFPPVVEQILQGQTVESPPGVVGRDCLSASDKTGPEPPDPRQFMVHDMDALPFPDFDDYFEQLARSPLRGEIEPLLFFETSRGCWWGQKHHCLFCGLNGSTLAFRGKSPRRAVDELRYLVERYHVHQACTSDNILDFRYFDTFLPMLAAEDLDLAFVYEMKTNLRRGQVETLLGAGLGAAQLGIETFITAVLKRIGKGATAMQNLQALKWFSEAGIA